mmetsp:Transcript_20575/g.30505  ORF Transcript_20575/g.30505 Transcript_20575/m.30505 type:complete len:81 (+) Transcript_20575:18-260(+)
MANFHRLVIYFDGASRNTPRGPAGAGWELYEMNNHGADGQRIANGSQYLGYNISSNQAEYKGLEAALDSIADKGISRRYL